MCKVHGIPTLPVALETLNWNCKMDQTYIKGIKLAHSNPVRDKSVHGWVIQTAKYQGHSIKQGTNAISTTMSEKDTYNLPKHDLTFNVLYSNKKYFSGPPEVTIVRKKEKHHEKKNVFDNDSGLAELPVHFSPKVLQIFQISIIYFLIHVYRPLVNIRAKLL